MDTRVRIEAVQDGGLMESSRTQQIKEAFSRVLDAEPGDREELLRAEFPDDEHLRAEVRRLVGKAESVPDEFLEPPPEISASATRARSVTGSASAGGGTASDPSHLDTGSPGQQVGPYELVRLIGEGGFGVVWEAEQKEPIDRRVALKLIKRGMDTKQVIARFEAERRALGLLGHPNISTVLDAGTTSDGRPYFAMELVDGAPILDYRRDHGLPLSQVLRILETVCRAIHHAHEQGIVHRDIKPSNILVTEVDGEVIPKVIDFGIAKAVGGSVRASGQLTRDRQILGTLAYMAPEQLRSDGLGVDARSDVYSIGVLIYEVLAGKPPFEGEDSSFEGHELLARRLNEEHPRRPSRCAVGMPPVPSDLDWITLRCLEIEPSRRYQSAKELADDIRRSLDDQPVVAGPPDVFYRARKFYRRHRIAVMSGTVVAGLAISFFVVGFFWTAWKNREYRREKRIAEQALADVERLSDTHLLDSLCSRARHELWPATPARIGEMEQWLAEASGLLERAELHRQELARLRVRALGPDEAGGFAPARTSISFVPDLPRFGDDEQDQAESEASGIPPREPPLRFATTKDAWLYRMLDDLVQRLDEFEQPESGGLASVQARLEFARSLEERSIDAHRQAWDDTVTAIATDAAYPVLRERGIAPQLGLVPLGRDPDSGLFEFLDLASHDGPIPTRDRAGRLALEARTGIVLVLIPGGSFWMGSQEDDPDGRNYDTLTRAGEGPVHFVEVEPFLLSKFEMTQSQWMKLEQGTNPSQFYYGLVAGGVAVTLRHPVEQVRWSEGVRVLRKAGLVLPSESQWEYATRAGSHARWFFGSSGPMLERYANLADRTAADVSMRVSNLDDGHAYTAPVGSFEPNPFGLHDVYGNVAEWCRDLFRPSYDRPALAEPLPAEILADSRRRVARGGAFNQLPNSLRSANRFPVRGDSILFNLGLRPARELSRD